MKSVISFLFLLLSYASYAQQVENIRPTIAGQNIEITYDLLDAENRLYDLSLYSSLDNYSVPLKYVSGDIGEAVAPGKNKKVIWEAKKELGQISGEIFLEIRGPVTAPFFMSIYPADGQLIRRGTTNTLTWKSKAQGQLRIDLNRSGQTVIGLGATQNTGSYRWTVPKDLEKGKGYSLQFTPLDNPGITGLSPKFIIGPKYGNGLKIGLAGILVGAGIYLLINGDNGGEPIPYPLAPDSN